MVDLLTREYEVNYSHIDNRGIAKPSFLWNIMQTQRPSTQKHCTSVRSICGSCGCSRA